MITPALSLTATERVLPRMALDFTTASLDSRVTVTRALNTATRINSSGYIEIVNADLPRFDFSPTSVGTCRGLLIEEARSNVCLRSSQFNFGEWANAAPNTPTISADTLETLSPDGTNSADKVTAATGGTASHLRQFISGTFSGFYTYSIFVKAGNSAQSRIRLFDNGFATVANALINWSGTTLTSLTSVTGTASFTPWIDGWYRVVVTTASLPSNASLLPAFYPDSSAGTGYVYLYGAQLEAGAFATSYIPTTTTSLTRNADAVTMTGTNFSSWFNATEGTITSEMSGTGTNFGGIAFDDGTNNNTIEYVVASGRAVAGVKVANVSQLYSQSAAITSGVVSKYALAYKQSNFAFSANTSVLGPYLSGNIPTVNRALIGYYLGANWYLNGHMRKVAYYPQRLINAEVQAFSKQ